MVQGQVVGCQNQGVGEISPFEEEGSREEEGETKGRKGVLH